MVVSVWTFVAVRGQKRGPAATLLRHTPTPKLVETVHSFLYKIFFTNTLPREKTRGPGKEFWQETMAQSRVAMLHCEMEYVKNRHPSGLIQRRSGPHHDDCRAQLFPAPSVLAVRAICAAGRVLEERLLFPSLPALLIDLCRLLQLAGDELNNRWRQATPPVFPTPSNRLRSFRGCHARRTVSSPATAPKGSSGVQTPSRRISPRARGQKLRRRSTTRRTPNFHLRTEAVLKTPAQPLGETRQPARAAHPPRSTPASVLA